MQAFAGFIIFVSFIVFILGVVNVIRPQAWMKVRKRLIGAFIILGSMAGCVGGSIMSMSVDPESFAASVEAGREAREAEEAKVAEEKVKHDEVRQTGMTQAEFNTLWSAVKSNMERCDAPLRRAGEAISSGNAYVAFAPVKAAGDACRNAWTETSRLQIPRSAKGDVKKALNEARSTCDTANYAKMQAMEQMAKVLDGDARPSVMTSLSEKVEHGKVLSTGCILAFMGAAEAAGLTLPEFDEIADEAEKKATK